ncbi:MAG: SDR family oxidoreductase, partial [Planctomycetes bacterium]|nr:SDR family oxidoreductase [Planctomycetota bacterium]
AQQLVDELSVDDSIVRSYQLDVLNVDGVRKLGQKVGEELGSVDILVNNAGASQVMPFAMIEEKDWDLIMDVNVKGMFLVTKAFARGMIRRKAGNIINMGSLAGMRMLEVPVHYATAKAAVVGFTQSLARELGRYNIRVNAVAPGMLTEGVSVNVPQKQQELYKSLCGLSRAGRPEEVAELAAFLASDRSSYINAQTILIDGGV